MNTSTARLILASMALLPAVAVAQQCGDTLHQHTTLHADIVCPPDRPFGLRIATSNVRLNLNGHTIYVPTTLPQVMVPVCVRTTTGILVEGADQVVIQGGRVVDDGWCSSANGIVFVESNFGAVLDMELKADRGYGVVLQGAADATIMGNSFSTMDGVVAEPYPVLGSASNRSDRVRITENRMNASSFQSRSFARLTGSSGTLIRNNEVLDADRFVYAWMSEGLEIISNVSFGRGVPAAFGAWAAIAVAESDGALIEGNSIKGGSVALMLFGNDHRVYANHLTGTVGAIMIGSNMPLSYASAQSRLHGNTLSSLNGGPGIWFAASATRNDARGNTFKRVRPDVLDQGSMNLY